MFTIENYPVFVMHHGNWDIFKNASEDCVAIPNKQGREVKAQASFFGRYAWVKEQFKL